MEELAVLGKRRGSHAGVPCPANATIGRDAELAEIGALLAQPDVRLLTLAGPGGAGKTRLVHEAARAAADRFPGGAVHVTLDGTEDAGVLVAEAAAALDVVAATADQLAEQLRLATGGAPALLVLDGFDRFIGDAWQVGRLLAAVENLKLLVSSRAPLRITAEHVYPVRPLAASDAAELFVARVNAARPDHEIDAACVDAICARLDGLPLAIELAADRARLLPLPALLAGLDDRLALLTHGPRDLPARQRSLRATLDWSWDVLDDAERTLLGRMTVFEGGASLEALEAVCDPGAEPLLNAILDKASLLQSDINTDGQPRFGMLDTIREFAAARATPADAARRHAAWFLDYSERAAEAAAREHRRDQLQRLALERGNLRLAFEWHLRHGTPDDALRIAIAFARALPWDAHVHEVRGWLAGALAAKPRENVAAALYWDGRLALSQAAFADAAKRLGAATRAAQDVGDATLEAAALVAHGRCAALVRRPDAAPLCERALGAARAIGDPGMIGDALFALASAYERLRDWDRVQRLSAEALVPYRAAGDPYGAAAALAELGWFDLVHGRIELAEERFAEAVALRERHGDDRRLVEPLINDAWLALARRTAEDARVQFLECLSRAQHMDDRFTIAEALGGLSAVAALEARWSDAARLAGASPAVQQRTGAPAWESVVDEVERGLAEARAALGAEQFAADFATGHARGEDQAHQ